MLGILIGSKSAPKVLRRDARTTVNKYSGDVQKAVPGDSAAQHIVKLWLTSNFQGLNMKQRCCEHFNGQALLEVLGNARELHK
jgi:hypothetical protein